MRRLLAAGSLAALVALGACTDSDNADQSQPPAEPTRTNTEEVCAGAATVQQEQMQQLNEDMTALEAEELPQEEYEQEAVKSMESALIAWSDGLREEAGRAEDPKLTEALTGLADGLADAAPQLTAETVRTGEIPGVENLQAHGQTLSEICTPAPAPSPSG
jgi:uncharacterized phage infection (PIP) family protein YhgE